MSCSLFFIIFFFSYSWQLFPSDLIRAEEGQFCDTPGYNPELQIWNKEANTQNFPYKPATVYMTGLAQPWKQTSENSKPIIIIGDKLPNIAICPLPYIQPADVSRKSNKNLLAKTYSILSDLKGISFGQSDEIVTAIQTLYQVYQDSEINGCYSEKDRIIHVTSYCRGSLVALNTLAALYETPQDVDAKLQKMGISSNEKAKIAQAVEKGSIVLYCPLRDFASLVEQHITQKVDYILRPRLFESFHLIYSWIGIFVTKILTKIALYGVLPLTTAYRPWKSNLATSFDILRKHNKKFRFLVLPEWQDAVVLDHDIDEFVDALPASPENVCFFPHFDSSHGRILSPEQKKIVPQFLQCFEKETFYNLAAIREAGITVTQWLKQEYDPKAMPARSRFCKE